LSHAAVGVDATDRGYRHGAQLLGLLVDGAGEPLARDLAVGEEGFDFLGFHHRQVLGWTPKSAHLTFLALWPSRKAAQHARYRIREITGRGGCWCRPRSSSRN
jgi:RNA-directed DNA polymerase